MTCSQGPTKVVVYAVGRAGIGHAMRARRLAEHVVRGAGRLVDVVVVTGHAGAAAMLGESERVRVRVPVATERLLNVVEQQSVPLNVVREAAQALVQVLAEIEPDVVVSTSPSGVHGEFRAAMDKYQPNVRTVLALRDIYDPPRYFKSYDGLDENFDGVLIAGPAQLVRWMPHQVRKSGQLPFAHVGYLRPLDWPEDSANAALLERIDCQVGGGRDGSGIVAEVVAAFAEVGSGSEAELHIDVGPYFDPAHLERLCSRRPTGLTLSIWSQRSQEPRPLAVISMAGYNSCVEAAWTGVPTLLWPRQAEDDREQQIRAQYFADLFDRIDIFNGDPAALRAWLSQHLGVGSVESVGSCLGPDAPDGFFADPALVAAMVLEGRQRKPDSRPAEDSAL